MARKRISPGSVLTRPLPRPSFLVRLSPCLDISASSVSIVSARWHEAAAKIIGRSSNLCIAAVYKQFSSRDVAAVVGCEKHDGFGSLIRRSEPSERNAFGDHLLAFLAHV
jgi:hypothetical protein